MTDMPGGNQSESSEAASRNSASGDGHVYIYESAGIAERDGHVPTWLWFVVVSLLIWGVYYLVTYWNAPVAPM